MTDLPNAPKNDELIRDLPEWLKDLMDRSGDLSLENAKGRQAPKITAECYDTPTLTRDESGQLVPQETPGSCQIKHENPGVKI